ncbi:MAG: response regulator [Actinomycetota bacterium]
MRADPRTSRTPIIVMTGLDDVSIEIEGLRLGVEDFVRKPFNPDVLLGRVENAIIRANRR